MTINIFMIATTKTNYIAVVTWTTTSRSNDIMTMTTDKVNDITTSHNDDETRDPQTSRMPEDEVVGTGAEPPTTIIPHCLRLHQEVEIGRAHV